jgi:hypothetical protein
MKIVGTYDINISREDRELKVGELLELENKIYEKIFSNKKNAD